MNLWTSITHRWKWTYGNIFKAQPKNEIKRCIQHRSKKHNDQNLPTGKAFLPYVSRIRDIISRVLQKVNIKTIYKPTRKIQMWLRSTEGKKYTVLSSGVCRILWTYGNLYIRKIDHSRTHLHFGRSPNKARRNSNHTDFLQKERSTHSAQNLDNNITKNYSYTFQWYG